MVKISKYPLVSLYIFNTIRKGTYIDNLIGINTRDATRLCAKQFVSDSNPI